MLRSVVFVWGNGAGELFVEIALFSFLVASINKTAIMPITITLKMISFFLAIGLSIPLLVYSKFAV